jgi:proline iminopeptidase
MKTKMFFTGLALALGVALSSCQKGELDASQPGNLVPLTVDQDPSLPGTSVNGTQLHIQAFGHPDSALLVVIHGGPGSDYRYLLNCKAFADSGFRVVFYDQRGSGLSKRHPKDSYSIQVMIDDLDAVIEHYKTRPDQKVFLLGHSWGAMLATAYIDTHPTEIDGAVLCEPGGFTYPQMKEYVSRSQNYGVFSETLNDAVYLDQFFTGKENQHEVLDYKFSLWASADGAEDNPIGNEGPLPFWRAGAVVNTALFEIADAQGFDFTANLQQFDTQILFVYSENNSAYGEQHARQVSSAYPDVQLFRVDEAGHDMLSFPQGWQNFYPVGLSYLNNLK